MYKCVMHQQENMDMLVKSLEIRNIIYPIRVLLYLCIHGRDIHKSSVYDYCFEPENVLHFK